MNSRFAFIERQGTLKEIEKTILQGETNLVVIKISPNQYIWFNAKIAYERLFPKLAQIYGGFYPSLFWN